MSAQQHFGLAAGRLETVDTRQEFRRSTQILQRLRHVVTLGCRRRLVTRDDNIRKKLAGNATWRTNRRRGHDRRELKLPTNLEVTVHIGLLDATSCNVRAGGGTIAAFR